MCAKEIQYINIKRVQSYPHHHFKIWLRRISNMRKSMGKLFKLQNI